MVVLSRSLADVTREAREVSGSEVALLVAGYTGTNRLEASRQLPSGTAAGCTPAARRRCLCWNAAR